MTVLWDDATKGPSTIITPAITGMQLSFGPGPVPYNNGARADTIKTSPGKFVFEVLPTIIGIAVDTGYGITNNASPTYGGFNPSTVGGLVVFYAGQTWYNGSFLFNNNDTRGHTGMWAIDLDNHKAWCMVTAAAGWNNDTLANQNPVGNVGGVDISAIDGAGVYPLGELTSFGGTLVGNFGALPFANPIPDGFVAWDQTAPVVATLHAVVAARVGPFRNYGAAGVGSGIVVVAQKPPVGMTLASNDRSDVMTAVMTNTIDMTMDIIDQSDGADIEMFTTNAPRGADLGEIIYKYPAEPVMYKEPDPFHSPFVIYSDTTMKVQPR